MKRIDGGVSGVPLSGEAHVGEGVFERFNVLEAAELAVRPYRGAIMFEITGESQRYLEDEIDSVEPRQLPNPRAV